ncbi:MAG: hypothetical protein WC763_01840 [Candidatus Paceibacterota bacterium]
MEYTSSCAFVAQGDIVVGISFGSEPCSEHENGHGGLREAFGIPQELTREVCGIDARTITRSHPKLRLIEAGNVSYLLCPPNETVYKDISNEHIDHMVGFLPGKGVSGAWDDSSFAIRIAGEHAPFLRRLHEAFEAKDIVIFQSGKGFCMPGLYLILRSAMPKESIEGFASADTSRLNLADAVDASGIKERLKAAGKKYLALSPRWRDEGNGLFLLWLNPWHQDDDNCGWFTVSDLDDWILGKGRIPKMKVCSTS